MENLSTIIQRVYSRLGQSYIGSATGGSTTTLIDNTLGERFADDDFEEGGSLIVVRTTDGEAPQGEYAKITSYSQDDFQFTFPAVSAAIGAGDIYTVAPDTFPLQQMIESVNGALKKLGDLVLYNTTIETDIDTFEYALPAELKRNRPIRVEIESRTGQYHEIGNYDVIPTAPGASALMRIPKQISGYNLRIWYDADHPTLTDFDSPIAETIHAELLVNAVLVEILDWYNSRTSGTDRFWVARQNKAEQDFANAKLEFKAWRPQRKVKGMPHAYGKDEDVFTSPPAA